MALRTRFSGAVVSAEIKAVELQLASLPLMAHLPAKLSKPLPRVNVTSPTFEKS